MMTWDEWRNATAIDAETRRKIRAEVDKADLGFHEKPYPVKAEDIEELFSNDRITAFHILNVRGDKVVASVSIENRCEVLIALTIDEAHDYYPGG